MPADELRQGVGLAGDHDKNERALRDAQRYFLEPVAHATGLCVTNLAYCRLSWAELDHAVEALAATPWAVELQARFVGLAAPRVVGVSVMFSDQVLAGLVAARAVRRAWPNVPIVWGGAHVTALAPELAADARYGRGIDGFIAGCTQSRPSSSCSPRSATDTRGRRTSSSRGSGAWVRARGAIETTPSFAMLSAYGAPRLTLPMQATRGCAYGKCRFCTYPFVEGDFVEPRTLDHVEHVVALAAERRALVSFKDALMTAPCRRRGTTSPGPRRRASAVPLRTRSGRLSRSPTRSRPGAPRATRRPIRRRLRRSAARSADLAA